MNTSQPSTPSVNRRRSSPSLKRYNLFERLSRSTCSPSSPCRRHSQPVALLPPHPPRSPIVNETPSVQPANNCIPDHDTFDEHTPKSSVLNPNNCAFAYSPLSPQHFIKTPLYMSFRESGIPLRIGSLTSLPRLVKHQELAPTGMLTPPTTPPATPTGLDNKDWSWAVAEDTNSWGPAIAIELPDENIGVPKVIVHSVLPEIDSRFSYSVLDDTDAILINTTASLEDFLEMFDEIEEGRVSLFIDLEGFQHGRNGTLSTIQFTFAHQPDVTYVVDILVLRERVFGTVGEHKKSIQVILEDPEIYKVLFDARQDSAALYWEWDVKLAGIIDVQLMELADRGRRRRYLSSLEKCIKKYVELTPEESEAWSATKHACRKYSANEYGLEWSLRPMPEYRLDWILRPMPEILLRYAANDTTFMPALYDALQYNLEGAGLEYLNSLVLSETARRIHDSQNPEPFSTSAVSPWEFSKFDHDDYYYNNY